MYEKMQTHTEYEWQIINLPEDRRIRLEQLWPYSIRCSLAHRRDLNLRPFDTLVKGREPNTGREAKQAERPNKQGG